MRTLGALLVSLLLARSASAACESVFLPDLAGLVGVAALGIPTAFAVPPLDQTPGGTGLYPFTVLTTVDGVVSVIQTVGDANKAIRQWTGVTRVSLVFWFHAVDYDLPKGQVLAVGYKTLPHQATSGEPTWAYRMTQRMDMVMPANFALSSPLQLGEFWNVGVLNHLPYTVWVNLQIEMSLCR